MATENDTSTAAPSADVAPATPAATPIVASVAPSPEPAKPAAQPPAGDKEPAWLAGRLDQAQRAILRELGVEDVKDAKAALAAYRADQEAKKSELQRAVERAAALEPAAKERDLYRARVEAMTSQTLAGLTPEQRTAVERLSGGDALKMADTIDLLRPTWASAPLAPPPAAIPPAPLPAAPANIAPPGVAPKPSVAKTKYDEWQDLEQSGKRNAASMFYAAHAAQIEQHRPA